MPFRGLLYLPRVTPLRFLHLLSDDIMRRSIISSITGHIPIEAIWVEYPSLVPVNDAALEGINSCLSWLLDIWGKERQIIPQKDILYKLYRMILLVSNVGGLNVEPNRASLGFRSSSWSGLTVHANSAIYIVIWRGLFSDPFAPNKVSALLNAKDRAKSNFLFFF